MTRTRVPARPVGAVVAAAVALAGCTLPGVDGRAGATPTVGASTAAAGTPAVSGAGTAVPHRIASPVDTVERRARAEVRRLSLHRLAAQLVVPDLGSTDAGVRGVEAGYGGVVVMASSLPSGSRAAAAAKAANARYARAMRTSGRSWPAFVAVDQEGGPVTRIGAPLTQFPSVMAVGAAGAGHAHAVGRASGAELRGLGFTVVLAPDADVTTPADPTIGVRSPGSDPRAVGDVALGLAAGYGDAGLVPVVKHFPGHGAVAADTHTGAAVLAVSRAELERRDLPPFRRAVAARVPAIMVGHMRVAAVDRARPASLSRPVVTGMLRTDLGFHGLVVTDALNMAAATQGLPAGEVAVRAVEAGADVVLMPSDPRAAVAAMERAVGSGRLTRARLEASAVRMIVALRTTRAVVPAAAPGTHRVTARRLAAGAVTQVAGRCRSRLVGRAVTITGGRPVDRSRLAAALTARGVRIGGAGATSIALLAGGTYRAGAAASRRPAATGAARADVLVALDVPYGLADRRAGAALAVYGRTPETFTALAAVLTGAAPAPGRLPVPVGAWRVGAGCV